MEDMTCVLQRLSAISLRRNRLNPRDLIGCSIRGRAGLKGSPGADLLRFHSLIIGPAGQRQYGPCTYPLPGARTDMLTLLVARIIMNSL